MLLHARNLRSPPFPTGNGPARRQLPARVCGNVPGRSRRKLPVREISSSATTGSTGMLYERLERDHDHEGPGAVRLVGLGGSAGYRRPEPLRGVRPHDRHRLLRDLGSDRAAHEVGHRRGQGSRAPCRRLFPYQAGAGLESARADICVLHPVPEQVRDPRAGERRFGDHVELGHFIEIVSIILTMLAGSALLRLVFRQLGGHAEQGR